jgi:hypothetical protein
MQNSALYSLAYTLVAASPHMKLENDKLIPNICIHIEEAKVTSIHWESIQNILKTGQTCTAYTIF